MITINYIKTSMDREFDDTLLEDEELDEVADPEDEEGDDSEDNEVTPPDVR